MGNHRNMTSKLAASLRGIALAGAALLASGPLHATNSHAELEAAMRDLLAWLPGEYSTYPQLRLERAGGEMPEGEHEDWYRTFARIDAPQLGPNVIYGELRVGGPEGALIPGQQVAYIVSIDDEKRVVNIAGRRIKDGEKFVAVHLHPEKWKDLAVDPRTGGNCQFRWRRHGDQLRGILGDDGKCSMVSKVSGLKMSFDAEWILNPRELWVFDNNYVEGQGLFMGREDRTHTRLYKVRTFRCESRAGAEKRSFLLHDRGGRAALGKGAEGRALQAELFRGPVELGSPPALQEQMWLAVYAEGAKDPVAKQVGAFEGTQLKVTGSGAQVSCRLAPPTLLAGRT